jgi:ferredoxin-type protein NapH
MKRSLTTSVILTLVMFLLLAVFVLAPQIARRANLVPAALWVIAMAIGTFLILHSGKVYRYRSAFFVIYGFAFVLVFSAHLIEGRGSMALSQETIARHEVPMCPVAIPQVIAPAVIKGIMIFPTKLIGGPYGGFVPVLFIWLVGVVTLGRAWCSWGCFFGGIDEGFSKVLRKPRLSTKSMHPRWRYLPFAVLIVTVMWAFAVLEPVYCKWLCPLKLVTEYRAITDLRTYVQAIIFITLGMGLLIILPILMKKRTHCALFCPLGALQSVVGLANPYRVRVDKDLCVSCGKCEQDCPTFSITKGEDKKSETFVTCVRCGKCIDICPAGARSYGLVGRPSTLGRAKLSSHIRGDRPNTLQRPLAALVGFVEEALDPSTLFLMTAILFGAILSGSFVLGAMWRLVNLAVHGTLLLH